MTAKMQIYWNMARYIFLVTVSTIFGCQIVPAQNADHVGGGHFLKRVEYNFFTNGSYNFKSKTEVEKLFFGDFNAKLEFFVAPSFEGAYGFRIVEDSLTRSCLIELKSISNFGEVNAQLNKEYPSIGFPAKEISSLSSENRKQAQEHNQAMYKKRNEESLKRYTVCTQRFPVKDNFADKLYAEVVTAINDFKGRGAPPIILDGYTVTFRCVVEDEVWTLSIHMPKGDMAKLTDICKQIFKDVEANNLDESKYITLLSD
jgi:hypothetical protein